MNLDFPEVSEQKKTEDKLKKYAKQQEILLQVSILFNTVDDFAKQVQEALGIVGSYTGVGRVYIFEDVDNAKASRRTFEWQQEGEMKGFLDNLWYEDVPSWRKTLYQKGFLASTHISTLPDDIQKVLSPQIKSVLVVPLFLKGKIAGFIGFDDYIRYKSWESSDLEFITTLSNVISHTFERHYAEVALKVALENQNKINQELIRQNNDLQQFTYIVSHNLRAPVANLLGLVSLYRPNNPDHEVNKISIDNIKTVSQQLDSIVRDLNEIVEIKQHLTAEVKENVYLEEELGEVFNTLERQIYHTQAQIDIDFSKVSHIFTVRKYLNSILLHLLSNALKYKHPERTPFIQINDEINDNFVCLVIKDNGLGIDLKKNASKIFGFHKRFHSHVEGKGLGLYLVKLQTEALGGWVEVESQLDQGSVFKVYLPK